MEFVTNENTWTGYRVTAFLCCSLLLCFINAGYAQTTSLPLQAPKVSHAPKTKGGLHRALNKPATATGQKKSVQKQKTNTVPLPISESSQPARVMFEDGKLLVEANNSNLAEILQDVGHLSGMTVNKMDSGPRIFGVYGPGNSRDVLIDLLHGSGYNFIMVGGAIKGTPRELILTVQNNSALAGTPAHPTVVPPAERDTPEPSELETTPLAPKALGPGAVAPVPSLDNEDDSTRAQANQQRLQHIQEQQQNSPQ